MDDKALEWWKTWKGFVLTTSKNLPDVFGAKDEN